MLCYEGPGQFELVAKGGNASEVAARPGKAISTKVKELAETISLKLLAIQDK